MKIKENIILVAALIAAICSIFMFYLGWDMGEKSHAIKDTTLYSEEDLTGSYNVVLRTVCMKLKKLQWQARLKL